VRRYSSDTGGLAWLRPGALFLSVLFLASFASGSTAHAAGPFGASWAQLEADPLVFHFQASDADSAAFLAAEGPKVLQRLSRETGLAVGGRIDVVLARDGTTFRRVQPSEPPIWAAGTAWSDRGEVYLNTGARGVGAGGLERVFTHEMVHIILGRAWKEGRPPRWLNEGLARFLSHELDPGEHVQLARAAVAGYLMPLEDFADHWPSGARRAHLAYIQSVEFVAFLDRQGPAVLPRVLARLTAGEELGASVLAVTGEPLSELEERWRSRMTFWHGVFPVLGSSGFLWGVTSFLFLAAGMKRRRQNREKIESLTHLAENDGDDGPQVWRQGFLAGRLDPPRSEDSQHFN
jgi:hypothetical protein